MIIIDIVKDSSAEDSFIQEIKVTGHSGYADKGFDIVCSAVSALLITFCNGVTEIIKPEHFYADVQEGQALLIADPKIGEDAKEKVNLFLRTLVLGLESIRDSYPDSIEIHYNNTGE